MLKGTEKESERLGVYHSRIRKNQEWNRKASGK
jgi:hypothetical protein